MQIELEARLLKEFASVLTSLGAYEVRIEAKDDGLYCLAEDPAHVAMAEMMLSVSSFKDYRLTSKERLLTDADRILEQDVEVLEDMLKLANDDEIIRLETCTEGGARYSKITLGATSKMTQMEQAPACQKKIDDLKYGSWVILPTDELYRAAKAAESVSGHVLMSLANPHGFKLEAEESSIPPKEKVILDGATLRYSQRYVCKDPAPCTAFALDYLEKMVQAIPTSEVKLWLATDFPLKAEFSLSDGSKVNYWIAPRRDNE